MQTIEKGLLNVDVDKGRRGAAVRRQKVSKKMRGRKSRREIRMAEYY